jgi:hypothetical protein
LVGLALGNQVWGGILNVDIAEDIVHLITGGILAYVGFGRTEFSVTRNVVGLLGIIYLMVGVLGFASPTMFGLIPHGYTAFDNLLHLVLGGLSLAVAWWFFGADPHLRPGTLVPDRAPRYLGATLGSLTGAQHLQGDESQIKPRLANDSTPPPASRKTSPQPH